MRHLFAERFTAALVVVTAPVVTRRRRESSALVVQQGHRDFGFPGLGDEHREAAAGTNCMTEQRGTASGSCVEKGHVQVLRLSEGF